MSMKNPLTQAGIDRENQKTHFVFSDYFFLFTKILSFMR